MLELNIEIIEQIGKSVSEDVKQQRQAIKEIWLKELKEAVERGKNRTLEDVKDNNMTASEFNVISNPHT